MKFPITFLVGAVLLLEVTAEVDSVVVFNEIHYHPAGDQEGAEFIELYNQNSVPVDLSGWTLEGAGAFVFPKGSKIDGRSYLVLAQDPEALGVDAMGPLLGRLANDGEELTLRNHNDRIMDRIDYGDSWPWPVGPDGSGASLCKREPSTSSGPWANWAASSTLGGTPGSANVVATPAGARISEVPSIATEPYWIELGNGGDTPVDLASLSLVSGRTGEEVSLVGELGVSGFIQIESSERPEPGERWFLTDPQNGRYLDAVILQEEPRARVSLDEERFLQPALVSPGEANVIEMDSRVVINEVMYHYRPDYEDPADPESQYEPNDEEWLEFYNRSEEMVDLSGWRLRDGIRYTFDDGVMLAAGAYLVVAKDPEALRLKHEGVTIVGGYSGTLGNGGDRVELQDALGNPADVLAYLDDRPWPADADGNGSSMELKHPEMDNSAPEAWAASDESGRSEWHSYSYRAVAQRPVYTAGVRSFHELRLGFLQAGSCLIDNVRVIEDPDGDRRQLVRNSTFGSLFAPITSGNWRLLGNHDGSEAISDLERGSVLKIEAVSAMNYLNNLCEANLLDEVEVGKTYEVSFDARWLRGSPQIRSEVYYNKFARKHVLEMPDRHGTPGMRNTAWVEQSQPTFAALQHVPVVPDADEDIAVSVACHAQSGLESVTLRYNVDEDGWQERAMALGEDERYHAEIPGQSRGDVVQFYVEAVDSDGGRSVYPAEGADSGAFVRVDDRAPTERRQSIRLITRGSDASDLHRAIDILSNARRDCTLIINESEAVYDCGVRLRGSMFSRSGGGQSGLNLKLPADKRFRGVHSTITLRLRNPQEILVKHMANQSGGLAASYNDFVELRGYRSGQSGLGRMEMARFGESYLAGAFEDGESSSVFKMEGIRDFLSAGAGGVKNPQPVGWIQEFDLTDLGDDKEQYRHVLRLINARKQDNYEGIMKMTKAFGAPDEEMREALEEILDVDQWARMIAMQTLCGIADVYPVENPHNFDFYQRPSDGKFIAMPWDWDFTFNLAPTSRIIDPRSSRKNLWRMLQLPGINRLYRGHLLDLTDTIFNEAYAREWFGYYGEVGGTSYASQVGYVRSRRSSVRGQAGDSQVFRITSEGGADFDVNGPEVTLEGTAGVRVRTIEYVESGLQLTPRWLDDETWQIILPLSEGANKITLQARDYQGSKGSLFTPTGSDAITVTNTGLLDAPTPETLRITEIMYHPAAPSEEERTAGYENDDDFEFIEFFNSGARPLSLRGLQIISGVQFAFEDLELAPGAYGVLVSNIAAFEERYGADVPVIGRYDGNLANGGERLTVATSLGGILHEVHYGDREPWAEAADGQGESLTLIDLEAGADLSDAMSWAASVATMGTPGGPALTDPNPGGVVYDDWAGGLFADGEAGGFDEDFDGDGYANGLEFAFGSDTKDRGQAPLVEVEVAGDGVTMTYPKRAEATVEIRLEASSDLLEWRDVTPDSEETMMDRVRWRLDRDDASRFLRLRVAP